MATARYACGCGASRSEFQSSALSLYRLSAIGGLNLSETLYLSLGWNPAASICCGLIFGYGMALAGNCGYGALARLGGGDLRSFVIVLVMGLSSYATIGGALSSLRIWAFGPMETATQPASFAHTLSDTTSLSVESVGIVTGLAILGISLLSRDFRNTPKHIIWGTIVGLAIASGWAGTY